MIFETDDKTLQQDLRAFLSLTADRQARFDAAPDAVPAVSGVNPTNSPRTEPLLQPVRTISFLTREPSSAPIESIIMDLPAPVSPVRQFIPPVNPMVISSINAIFLILSDLSI